jgi:hypothetical protein
LGKGYCFLIPFIVINFSRSIFAECRREHWPVRQALISSMTHFIALIPVSSTLKLTSSHHMKPTGRKELRVNGLYGLKVSLSLPHCLKSQLHPKAGYGMTASLNIATSSLFPLLWCGCASLLATISHSHQGRLYGSPWWHCLELSPKYFFISSSHIPETDSVCPGWNWGIFIF